jgi:hypothetical protein
LKSQWVIFQCIQMHLNMLISKFSFLLARQKERGKKLVRKKECQGLPE